MGSIARRATPGSAFVAISCAVAAIVFAAARAAGNDYVFVAGYTVLQFIVLATAWNILGGYTGYVNFGSAAFFALGAYTTVFFHKLYPLPVPVLCAMGAVVSGIVGLGTGYLTLRLRGAFFSIATLALAVVLQTVVVNWNYVGGARGAYVIRRRRWPCFTCPMSSICSSSCWRSP
jgi:branched-chain amino acid transport system permease protein